MKKSTTKIDEKSLTFTNSISIYYGVMIRNKKEKNVIGMATDTECIFTRYYQDTLVTREIPNQYGHYNVIWKI